MTSSNGVFPVYKRKGEHRHVQTAQDTSKKEIFPFKKFTVDRKYHFCLKWSCLVKSPPMSNLLTPPGNIKLDKEVATSLTAEDYQTIFSQNLPVEWLKY